MDTPITERDLTKQAPQSQRERTAGFAIADRITDKCRASLTGTLGEYHYDCPLDKMLFTFKGLLPARLMNIWLVAILLAPGALMGCQSPKARPAAGHPASTAV